MPYKEKDTVKLFYSIGEVSKTMQVTPSLIRFWEKEFDIIKPSKNKKGNRMFTQNDVDNLKLIYHLVKERGYTLKGAKIKLKTKYSETKNTAEIVQSLNKIKEFLIEVKNQLP